MLPVRSKTVAHDMIDWWQSHVLGPLLASAPLSEVSVVLTDGAWIAEVDQRIIAYRRFSCKQMLRRLGLLQLWFDRLRLCRIGNGLRLMVTVLPLDRTW